MKHLKNLRLISVALAVSISFSVQSQDKKPPYEHLPDAPASYTAGTVASRLVDGLGFRFYWATEGLRPEDLAYKPSAEGRTSRETLEHIYSMSAMVLNATRGTIHSEPDASLPFDELRRKTLENLKAVSDKLRGSTDQMLNKYSLKFKNGEEIMERPFWNLISGPIEDCVWHVGQVVTFRRSSGNPISEKINFFTGAVN